MSDEILDLIQISKSSILSKLVTSNYSIPQVVERAYKLQQSKKSPVLFSKEQAEQIFLKAKKFEISLISFYDSRYPSELKQINDPPLIIYAKGNLNLLTKPKFAIIGARSATLESIKIAKDFANNLSQFGFTIVSGFAYGVDTASCIGALDFGTIQVLGSGINKIYPIENKKLYEEVLQHNGLFISEFPPDFPVKPENFPLRNRIISGISKGVLLVQAGRKNGSSGSLITAKIALNQDKDLFAIPGHPMDQRFEGGNNLLKYGSAIFTTTPKDITDMIGYHIKNKTPLFEFNKTKERTKNDSYALNINHKLCNNITEILGTQPLKLDEIANFTKQNIRDVQIALAELELLNKVRKHRCGGFSLNLI